MPDAAFSVPLHIALAYQHPLGDLSPFFSSLLEGKLIAAACDRCKSVWVPPRLVCTCGSASKNWTALAGTGSVESTTTTSSSLPGTAVRGEMTFVLVRFDGATNRSLARFVGALPPARGTKVRLRKPLADAAFVHPVQALEVEVA